MALAEALYWFVGHRRRSLLPRSLRVLAVPTVFTKGERENASARKRRHTQFVLELRAHLTSRARQEREKQQGEAR
jgi:hypothetical protein